MSQNTPHTKFHTHDNHTYAYEYSPGPAGRPTFLLLHGFPSTRNIWNKVAHLLTSAGYGVLRPDLLGYGESSKPKDVQEYSFRTMSMGVAGILAHENLQRVIGVGHDWGSVLLARLWWYFPESLSGLAFMSVAYGPPMPEMNLDAMNEMTKKAFGYEMGGYWYFLTSPEAHELVDKNVASATSLFYQSDPEIWKSSLLPTGKLQQWLTEGAIAPVPYAKLSPEDSQDHEQLNESFQKGGFAAPLNWYKSALYGIDKDYEAAISGPNLIVTRPVSFIVGEHDAVGRPDIAMDAAQRGEERGQLPNLQIEAISGTGHWMMLEKPDATFEALEHLASRV